MNLEWRTVEYFEHEGGTKFYRISVMVDLSMDRLWYMVTNWGAGSALGDIDWRAGQMKIEVYHAFNAAALAAEEKAQEKEGRGYRRRGVREGEVTPHGLRAPYGVVDKILGTGSYAAPPKSVAPQPINRDSAAYRRLVEKRGR